MGEQLETVRSYMHKVVLPENGNVVTMCKEKNILNQ